MKRLLMIAAAVAVLGLAAVAVGGAATSAQEGDGPLGTFLSKVAEKLGVSEDELKDAIQDTHLETIDEAVAKSRLTEEQGERLRECVEEGGILFPPRPRHHGPRLDRAHGLIADAAAQVLDMEKEELIEARQDGQSLAEIAEDQGMSAEQFTEALLDQVRAQLDELVAEGELTEEQAERIFQRTEENIDRIVSGEGCLGGFGGPRHGPGGFGGPPLEEPASAEEAEVTA